MMVLTFGMVSAFACLNAVVQLPVKTGRFTAQTNPTGGSDTQPSQAKGGRVKKKGKRDAEPKSAPSSALVIAPMVWAKGKS
ncbi:MAG: hypothetical protein U5J62_08910 [Desulfurivibrio sp.]|nr:hypothetical protein [Desulfurivibrio sp.]